MQKALEQILDLVGKIVGILLILMVLWLVAMVLCVFAIFIIWAGANSSAEKFDVTYGTWDNLSSVKVFGIVEDLFMNPLRGIFGSFQKNVIFSSEFRFVLLLIVVLEVCTMGLALLIGHDKLTVKDIGVDILITFGGAAILLSPDVMEYLNFAYGIITAVESWVLTILRQGVLQNFNSVDYSNPDANATYVVMDMIAGMFFDPVIAKRVQTKMTGLLFAGYIHFIPVFAIVLCYCLLCTFSVFLAILSGKIIVFFTLQLIPFFLLFSALNDAKVKISKDLRAKSQSFLWAAVENGIIKPSLFIILVSFVSNFMLYAFVLVPINDIFQFTVYIHVENAWAFRLTWVPIFGPLFELLIKMYPKAIGMNHNKMFNDMVLIILGLFFFRQMFPIIVGMISAICEIAGTDPMAKNASESFSEKGSFGQVTEAVGNAPIKAVKSAGGAMGGAMGGAIKSGIGKIGSKMGEKGGNKDDDMKTPDDKKDNDNKDSDKDDKDSSNTSSENDSNNQSSTSETSAPASS